MNVLTTVNTNTLSRTLIKYLLPKFNVMFKFNCSKMELFIQLNPGNSQLPRKLKLLRVIGVLNYRGFEQKDQKHFQD